MKARKRGFASAAGLAALLAAMLICGASAWAQENKPGSSTTTDKLADQDKQDKKSKKDSKADDGPTTTLKIVVTGNGKPVGNASVYVRFNTTGGFLRKDKLAEVDLKTNEGGTAKVRDLPRGKIQVQVVAKGWHTFGQWFDMDSDDKLIEVKLEPPPHWY